MYGFMDTIEIPIDLNIIKVIRQGPKDLRVGRVKELNSLLKEEEW